MDCYKADKIIFLITVVLNILWILYEIFTLTTTGLGFGDFYAFAVCSFLGAFFVCGGTLLPATFPGAFPIGLIFYFYAHVYLYPGFGT